MEHGGFPSDETLAAFIDGSLDSETRRRVIEHLVGCSDCYAAVVTATDFLDGAPPPLDTPRPRRGRRRGTRRILTAVASFAIAAVVLAVLAMFHPFREQLDRWTGHGDTASLAAAARGNRKSVARLHGFPYRPFAVTRGPAPSVGATNYDFLVAAADVQKAAERDPSPRHLHALGVSYYLSSDWDSAVVTLETALRKQSGVHDIKDAIATTGDEALLNDLAAAYLARGENKRQLEDLNLAADAAARAWRLDPKAPDALWNRAATIEALKIPAEAIAAWRAYIAADPQSPWSEEARQHLHDLERPTASMLWPADQEKLVRAADEGHFSDVVGIVGRYPLQSRLFVSEQLLPSWATAYAAHDAGTADEALRRSRAIADALLQTSGEALPADGVTAIESADSRSRARLAAGHIAFAKGRETYVAGEIAAAAEHYARAERALAGSPYATFAAFEHATCRFMQNDYVACATELEQLRAGGGIREGYLALAGRVDWVLGLTEDNFGHPQRAFDLHEAALARFTKLGESDNIAALHTLLADLLERMGENEQALEHHAIAVAQLAQTGSDYRRHQILFEAAVSMIAHRDYAIGELLLDQLASFERDARQKSDPCMTFMWRAVLHGRRGETALARSDFETASSYCREIPDANVRARAMANLTLAATDANLPQAQSLDTLTKAIDFFESRDSHLWLAQLYGDRAAAYRRRGDLDRAAGDLRRGIDEVEHAAMRVDAPTTAGQSLYDDLLDVLVAKGDAGGALLVAERAATRRISGVYGREAGLRDVFADEPGLASVAAMQKRIPDGVVVVAIAHAHDRLLLWTIGRNRFDFVTRPIAAGELARNAEAFSASVRDGASPLDVQRNGRPLSQLLLGGWLPSVPRGTTLVFVAGSGTEPVAFAALTNPAGGRFLIEDYAVASASGVGRFLRALDDDARRATGTRALFVAPDAESLPPLPHASAEVAQAALQWTSAASLEGRRATKRAFLRLASDAAVILFAGHALPNDHDPLLSALVFARGGGAGDDGLLYAHELAPSAFGRVRLFILSACSTGRALRPEMSFASALAAQRVPSVIGSLWDADDRASAELFAVFHDQLHHGASRAASLRTAQLELLHGDDAALRRPAAWAAFQLIGAVSPLFEEERHG